jgi:16S rRNA G966 N2-methylase RsmD
MGGSAYIGTRIKAPGVIEHSGQMARLQFGPILPSQKAPAERFDVVFLDPPFRQNALPAVLERLPERLAPGARVYVEAPEPLEASPSWRELKRSRAGQVSYQLLERR